MTNEQINNLEKRPYTFGDKKGIEVSYDEETNAVVIPEALFRYILSQIPSRLTGHWIRDAFTRTCPFCNTMICETDDTGDFIPDKYCSECGAKME